MDELVYLILEVVVELMEVELNHGYHEHGQHVLQIVVIQISIKYEMHVMQYEQDIIQQIIH